MKYAFSTLGVPGMPMRDVARLATATGYQGVELRAHPEEPIHPGSSAGERAQAVEEFAREGIEILTVSGYARVAAPGEDLPVHEEIGGLLRLARDLGASYIRVFPGGGDEQSQEEADATAARRLGVAAEHAADMGVRILMETHDSHRTGAAAARVLGPVGHKNAGALWDVMHTWLGEETPAASHAVLAPQLGYTQVKDIASADDKTPLALGAGVLPLADCVAQLVAAEEGHADAWLCWEYEKRWYPQAAELPPMLAAGREYLEGLVAGAGR
ncbi:MAG TPA: sugar phosphate isomerase/epimerase family protein [Streptomyces sp.]|nr:sugar phosphate isomerase/epimerase family protein [Streptomyces sp.]